MRDSIADIIKKIFDFFGIDPLLGMLLIFSLLVVMFSKGKWKNVTRHNRFYVYLGLFYILIIILLIIFRIK
jgi:hypothetical protein